MEEYTRDDLAARDHRAMQSLTGLCTADAYGQLFFASHNWVPQHFPGGMRQRPQYRPGEAEAFVAAAHEPPGPWPWTDDSQMACGVLAELRRNGSIDPDALVRGWAQHFELPRDYGPGALDLLYGVRDGGDWRGLSSNSFDGAGSRGNGAAMRIAPLGAWFADNLGLAAEQSRIASETTHTHADGIAGGVAVALAAALAARHDTPAASEFISTIMDQIPRGAVWEGLRKVRKMSSVMVTEVATSVGNGSRACAEDTVPLAIWVAANIGDDYPRAIRTVVAAGGDMDTNAAIVGGIIAAGEPNVAIPPTWLAAREALPDWLDP